MAVFPGAALAAVLLCGLLRGVIGKPFRPIAFGSGWMTWDMSASAEMLLGWRHLKMTERQTAKDFAKVDRWVSRSYVGRLWLCGQMPEHVLD